MKRLLALFACVVVGCGGKVPPLSSQAQALVKKFEQQLPKHQTAAFDQLCKEVDKMHEQKKLTDEEYQALHKVCGQAKDGQWDRATDNLKPLKESMEAKKK
jgi:hypothetical protein